MTVSVVEVAEGTAGALGTVPTVTLATTPVAGDVVIITVLGSTAGRLVTGITGLGATWREVVTKSDNPSNPVSGIVWRGDGATAAGVVSVTLDATMNGSVRAFLARGLTPGEGTSFTGPVNSSAGPLDGPVWNASVGQLVLELGYAGGKTGNLFTAVAPAAGWVIQTGPAGATAYCHTAYRIPTEGTSTAHQMSVATGGISTRLVVSAVFGASLTEGRVGGAYAEALYGVPPAQVQVGNVTLEALTYIPPPVLAVGGMYVEMLSPRLLPTLGVAGTYLEVLVKMGGSNVHDHTGTQRNVFLLTDGGLVEQIFTTNP